MKLTKLKSTIAVGMFGLILGAAGCGDEASDTNPITTGGIGGAGAVGGAAGAGATGGVGGTAGAAGAAGMMMPATGGASGMGTTGGTGGMGTTGGTGGMGTTGGTGGMGTTGGTGGMGTTGGTGGSTDPEPTPEVAACIAGHFDGVNDTCKQCMCECDEPTASECDESCWQLSLCVYQHCQQSMPVNQGEATQLDCVMNYCAIYYGDDFGMAATNITATGCFGPDKCGIDCAAWWGMSIESGPMMAM